MLSPIYAVRLCRMRQVSGLRHELFRVNQTYNSLTTVVYVKKIVVGLKRRDNRSRNLQNIRIE